jgi:hypothetical protein
MDAKKRQRPSSSHANTTPVNQTCSIDPHFVRRVYVRAWLWTSFWASKAWLAFDPLDTHGVLYGTGERTSTGVSSANEARTACYVLYKMWRRWLQHESRKRALLQNQRRTTLQWH